uniref:Uncharacterized protein n=1 Tax=Anguilla anguilla TaxID=7936 RepID=A0A0E9W870_ANGAN
MIVFVFVFKYLLVSVSVLCVILLFKEPSASGPSISSTPRKC